MALPIPGVRAVIFDFNGVIVDDERVHLELFAEALATAGVELTEADYYDRYLGFDDRGCFGAALTDAGRPAGAELLGALIALKARRYLEVIGERMVIFPGAAGLVRGLAERGLPLAICSGALAQEIDAVLAAAGLDVHFPVRVAAEEVARGKPDPEGFHLARARLAAARRFEPPLAAGDCLVVEDSHAGIAGARAAGMRVVAVASSYPAARLSAADAVVESLAGLTAEALVGPG